MNTMKKFLRGGGVNNFGNVANVANANVVPISPQSCCCTLAVFVALCAALAPSPSSAATQTVTNTVNGITWQLQIDTSANTVSVGPIPGNNPDNSTGWSASDYAGARAIAQSVTGINGVLEVPAKFRIDGTDYSTTHIGNRAFIRCRKISTLVLPLTASTFKIWTCAFWEATGIVNAVFKGPATVAPGETQSYNTFTPAYDSIFDGATAVKRVLVGPNVKLDSSYVNRFTFDSATNAVVLLPSTSENATWAKVPASNIGADATILRYGLSNDRTAITFSTADADELIAFLDFAPLVREYLDLDVRLSVTNAVAQTEEQTTKLSAFAFDAHSHVTFETATAAQYANTIAAVPGSATILCDPAKLRGATLAVPTGRRVIVPLPNGGKYSPNGNGTLTVSREAK